ncbi:MAG: DUF1598 domain-containing protein, partial [Planctomycetota bacterium]
PTMPVPPKHSALLCLTLGVAFLVPPAGAQPFPPTNGGNPGGAAGPAPAGRPGPGGGANADFDSLIDLIISTVAAETWAENGGGEAEIRPYVNGVYADSRGVLRRYQAKTTGSLATDLKAAEARLGDVRTIAEQNPRSGDTNPRVAATLRCVSIGRLERELQRRRIAKEPVDPAMLPLAGLRRVRYVIVLPPEADKPGDVVLAGPAGDWRVLGDGRIVASDTGEAVVRLDDLITLVRRTWAASGGAFGCSINPRPEALAAAQTFLNEWQTKSVSARRRDAWLEELRAHVGQQDIEVFGIDPTSRAAGVLVEADHHMKLVGLGLAEATPGIENYLDGLANSPQSQSASTGVLRWWFAMSYKAIHAAPEGDAFELIGPGAKVMSEKEMLTERGKRVAAGGDPIAEGFASAFSRHFGTLCRKYPVYSELRNVFDLSLAVELAHAAAGKNPGAWRPTLLVDARRLPMPAYEPAKTVETVVNHRTVNRRKFVAGVSGGVWGDARQLLVTKREAAQPDSYGPLGQRPIAPPDDLSARQWWWDAAE